MKGSINDHTNTATTMKLITTPRSTFTYASPFSPLFGRELERWIAGTPDPSGPYRPDLDVREDSESVTVVLDLPGVSREDVQVTFHDGVLTLAGERKVEAIGQQEVRSYRERPHGRFERRVTIECPIHDSQIRATHKDGVLTVVLPKTAEVRPRQIEIASA